MKMKQFKNWMKTKKVKKTKEVEEEESAQKPVELDKNLDEMKEQEKDQQREIIPKPLNPSPAEETDAMRKEKIREMMRSAWVAYRNYSWGANELKPIAKTSHNQNIFGGSGMAATIVDGADTLYIMGLKEEYEQARDFIRDNFDIKKATGQLSVFETTIRFVGGLLTMYGLTKEKFYLDKAKSVADVLLPAFNTPTGIAKSLLSQGGSASNYGWAGSSSILAEFGTLHLEFAYLTEVTGDPVYLEKVQKIRDTLDKADKPDGLYPTYMSAETGRFANSHISLGALGDSFYEYLIKSWVMSGKTDDQALRMHKAASDAIQKKMVFTSKKGLKYVAELRGGSPEHKMGHLACFAPGMFALEAHYETDSERKAKVMGLAEDLANTCHESYIRSESRIGPEMFYFTDSYEAITQGGDSGYILRPEVLEGFFYLWRLTGKQKYKDWVWDGISAIEKHCRIESGGYAGLKNVYKPKDGHDDVQQSFFLAETLKYAYLTFADDAIPLDRWVFNTEAHPLPIKNAPISP